MKSARRAYDSHRARMGVYLVFLEVATRVRPPLGSIVTGDGARHRIENTDKLWAWVLSLADQIWATRIQLAEIIQVDPRPDQYRRGRPTQP